MFSHKISRRAKASTIAAVAAAGVLALGSQLPGSADAAIDPFVPYDALTDPELAELRGGFSFNGFDFDIAIDVILKSFVDDLGLISVLKFNNDDGVETSTTFFPPAGGSPDPQDGQSVEVTDEVTVEVVDEGTTDKGVETSVATTVSTDTTTIVHELNENTFKSIVSTTGSSQTITNTAQFDITISATLQAALDSFSQNILASSIGTQIGLSSLF